MVGGQAHHRQSPMATACDAAPDNLRAATDGEVTTAMESMRAGFALLAVTSIGIVAGAVAAAAGNDTLRDVAWVATILVALVPVTWNIVRDLIAGHAGVDVVAILAMAGALALGEFLAGAVIGLMMASGIT